MDFVDFNLAKKLRKKGFKEDCLCYYNHIDDDVIYNIESPIANNQLLFCHNRHNNVWHKDDDNCDAPTISQVLKWLRKEKKIHISIDVSYIVCKYGESLYKYRFYITNLSNHERNATLEDFDSFEETALAGIEYVLDNFI